MIDFLQAYIHWVVLAAAATGGLGWTLLRDSAQSIDHAESILWIKQDKGVFVDLRSAADFGRGRIPHSRNIPVAELKKRAAEIDRYREKPVVLVCANGAESRRNVRLLTEVGFSKVRAMRGGMGAWREAQMPVLKK